MRDPPQSVCNGWVSVGARDGNRHSVFRAEVWGTVADWFAAVGTAGAAVTALGYYIYESRRRRKAQARLVQARIENPVGENIRTTHTRMSIRIVNSSEHPISEFYVLYREKNLLWTLLTSRRFDSYFIIRNSRAHRIGLVDVKMTQHASREGVLSKPKSTIVGYNGMAGYIRPGGQRRLAPGDSCVFSKCFVGQPYRFSTRYWVGFLDANGTCWEREAAPSNLTGYGKLRRGKRSPVRRLQTFSERRWRPLNSIRWSSKVFVWWVKNIKEKTADKMPWEDAEFENRPLHHEAWHMFDLTAMVQAQSDIVAQNPDYDIRIEKVRPPRRVPPERAKQ